jgi:hypothetical protein
MTWENTLLPSSIPQDPGATASRVQIVSRLGDAFHATYESLALPWAQFVGTALGRRSTRRRSTTIASTSPSISMRRWIGPSGKSLPASRPGAPSLFGRPATSVCSARPLLASGQHWRTAGDEPKDVPSLAVQDRRGSSFGATECRERRALVSPMLPHLHAVPPAQGHGRRPHPQSPPG